MLKFLAVTFVILVIIRIILTLYNKAINKLIVQGDKEAAKHNNYFPYKVDEDEF